MTPPDQTDPIRAVARARAEKLGLPYAGALLPGEAWALMQAGAKLIDVRTRAELDWVGRVPGALPVEWNRYPGGALNTDFLTELGGYVEREDTVMFLCRSGGRSHNAAVLATEAGYRACYNVLEGFEGDKDASQHRNSVGGWRHAGLPWIQG